MTEELSLKEYINHVEGNIRRDIATLTEHIKEGQKNILLAVNSHEKRLGRLENWRSAVVGGVGVLIVIITILLKVWK